MAVKGFILCAGLGTRLDPLTQNLAKPLVPVGTIPLVIYALAFLRRAGIHQIGINVHGKSEEIVNVLGDGSELECEIEYFREERPLGTGGGIRNAAAFMGNDILVTINGDTLWNFDLRPFLKHHLEGSAPASLVLHREAPLSQFGGIAIDEKNLVRALVLRGKESPQDLRTFVYTGISILEPEMIAILEKGGDTPCLLRQGILPAVETGAQCQCFITEGYFSDLGTPERYFEANMDLFQGRFSHHLFDEAKDLYLRRFEGGINTLGLNLRKGEQRIGEGAAVGPYTILGDRVRVGKGAQIRNAVLWDKTAVEEGVKIDRAIVFGEKEILPIGLYSTTV